MGIRFESGNITLPTTKLLLAWRKIRRYDPERAGEKRGEEDVERSQKSSKSFFAFARTFLLVLNLFMEEWYRQCVAWIYVKRGFLVLFERHFIADYFAFVAVDPDLELALGTRLHGFILKKLYPEPDLVILLDGSPEVFFERKGEGTVERIQKLREGYLKYGQRLDRFEIIDAVENSQDAVADKARLIIHGHLQEKMRDNK